MKALIFDTETTNTDDTAEIIEAAWINKDTGEEYCARFQPTGTISFGAMAVHNIMPHDLTDCEPSSAFVLPICDFLIGHNVDFDWKMAGSPNVKRICTLALSRYLWPELDSHKQAAVMYFLFEAEAQELVRGAHNALEDVRMCQMILTSCLGELEQRRIPCKTWGEIWQASEVARVPTVMSFGKHKGMAIKDVPRGYVQWYLRQSETDPYLVKAFTEAAK
jgi:exodeoxyribonuclease X